MKEEEDRLEETRKKLEKRLNHFKDYVIECMIRNNIEKIDTDLGCLTLAKNPISVEIVNTEKIPSKYKKITQTEIIDKRAILNDFKDTGEVIEGVSFNTESKSLRIK